MACDIAHCATCGCGQSQGVGRVPLRVVFHQHGQVIEARGVAAQLLPGRGRERGMQFAMKAADRFEIREIQPGGGLFDGLQPCQHPDGIGELVAQSAQSAIAHAFRKQAVAAGGATLRDCLDAQTAQELDAAQHVRLQAAEVRPVLAQLGLPHQGEHGDAGVLPMLPARAGEDAAVFLLEGPRGFQPLLRFAVVAQVSGGLQDEVAIHHPETPVDRGPHLEREAVILPLAGLHDVARARGQKLAIPAGHAP